jgi:hypothetical protein
MGDQVNGAYAVHEHIAQGGVVSSVDLSSATDRFPRIITNEIISAVGYPEYADALEELCGKPFYCDFSPSGEVKYDVGQPMGLYGSFPAFHLSNLCFAMVAERLVPFYYPGHEIIRFKDQTSFKVLGDDIVFSDQKVAAVYKQQAKDLGLVISDHKSFEGQVAEFAGFIAVPTRKSVTMFRPYKVPEGNTITNPLEFLHGIGSRVVNLRGNWWKKQFRAYSATLGARDLSLTPLITDDSRIVGAPFRGDNHWVMALSNRFADSELREHLPDLSGNTKINSSPLFRERGPMDLYGFNPEFYRHQDNFERRSQWTIPRRLSSDPLIKEYLANEQAVLDARALPQDSTNGTTTGDQEVARPPDRPLVPVSRDEATTAKSVLASRPIMSDWNRQISEMRSKSSQSPAKQTIRKVPDRRRSRDER